MRGKPLQSPSAKRYLGVLAGQDAGDAALPTAGRSADGILHMNFSTAGFPWLFQPESTSRKQITGTLRSAPAAGQTGLLGPRHSPACPRSQRQRRYRFGLVRTSAVSSGTILPRFPSEPHLIFAAACLEEQPGFSLAVAGCFPMPLGVEALGTWLVAKRPAM